MKHLKTILTIMISSVATVGVLYAATIYTDTTPGEDETIKEIEKEELVTATSTTVIDMGDTIDKMNHAKGDIETILDRFNAQRVIYNEGLSAIKSKTSVLGEATCSFPTIPTKVPSTTAALVDDRVVELGYE